jgi:hypothetical protein
MLYLENDKSWDFFSDFVTGLNEKMVLIINDANLISSPSEKRNILEFFTQNCAKKYLPIIFLTNLNHSKLITTLSTQDLPINNIKWARNTCKYELNNTLKKVLDDNKITEGKIDDLNSNNMLIMPCTYDDGEKEINNFPNPLSINQKYFVFDNVDLMTAKDNLWSNIVDYHGYDKAITLMPVSYNLANTKDLNKLKQDFTKDKLYIMKKNIQRQEGLKISNSLNEILENTKNYVVVQELLQDPYLIKKRKINMRFYVLITCEKNRIITYVFNDGFMYYTKDEFKQNSLDFGPNITTGYIDRYIYEVNPLTHEDFKKYLDEEYELTEAETNLKGLELLLLPFIYRVPG